MLVNSIRNGWGDCGEKEELLEQLPPNIDVLVSDLMGKYGANTREPLLDFGVAIYKHFF